MKAVAQEEFDKITAQHQQWLDTNGREGSRAIFDHHSLREINFVEKRLDRASFIKADLHGMMICDASFQGADFTEANLYGSSLERVNCDDAIMIRTDLLRINQCSPGDRKVSMRRVDFTAATLVQAFFNRVDLTGARFERADLREGMFIYCNFDDAQFLSSDLKESNFRFAHVARAKFIDCNMENSDFLAAEISEAIFQSDVSNVKFLGKDLESLRSAAPKPAPLPDLVTRLSEGRHEVQAMVGKDQSLQELRQRIEMEYIHIKFPHTRGGTELGVKINKSEVDYSRADMAKGEGQIVLTGTLNLNFIPVKCNAEIDLRTLTGMGYLERLDKQ